MLGRRPPFCSLQAVFPCSYDETGTPSTVTKARPPQVLSATMSIASASSSSAAAASPFRQSPSMMACAAAYSAMCFCQTLS